ncbi:uncharacterized protein [Dermacentor albipictus]
MCEHPPMTLCRQPTAKEPVMYDPDGDTCNYHRPGRNCLAGDNRFRDMASCEAACGGPRRNPACSAPVRMHTCIPGVETNSSAHYHFADYCLPVDRGYCLIGQGFSSEQECIDVCKDEGTNLAECENNNLAVCNLSAHLYQVAFFRGHCERRAHICPRSVGFTSVSHCARMCTSISGGRTDRPVWADSCNLPNEFGDADNLSPAIVHETLDTMANHMQAASKAADEAKRKFVAGTFSDSEFEQSVADYTQPWLPEMPTNNFESMTTDEVYQTVYQTACTDLQYYAVAMEQAMMDQAAYHKPFQQLFADVKQSIGELLCELWLGIERFQLDGGPDVQHDVMPDEFRNMEHDGHRNVRDYIALRDYERLTQRIYKCFIYLRDRH